MEWKPRKFAIKVRGPKNFWVTLDCLGHWTCHPEIKCAPKPVIPEDSKTWVVTHVITGLRLVGTREALQARKVVEFLAQRWPRPPKLADNRELLKVMWQEMAESRERGELLFYGTWETEDALLPFEARRLESELIAALLG